MPGGEARAFEVYTKWSELTSVVKETAAADSVSLRYGGATVLQVCFE